MAYGTAVLAVFGWFISVVTAKNQKWKTSVLLHSKDIWICFANCHNLVVLFSSCGKLRA